MWVVVALLAYLTLNVVLTAALALWCWDNGMSLCERPRDYGLWLALALVVLVVIAYVRVREWFYWRRHWPRHWPKGT